MKLEEIHNEWDKDAVVERTDLGHESLKIPKLHSKYMRIYSNERLLLRKYEAEMKLLKLEKYEFYTQGPSKEQIEKGWELPSKGKIIKQEVPFYLEADKDVVDLSLKIGYTQEKITLLESIVKTIHNRNFEIRAAIDWIKWTEGS